MRGVLILIFYCGVEIEKSQKGDVGNEALALSLELMN